jgi:peptide/nickel transport system substrate-binding protein
VRDSSFTYSKDPDYWWHDQRYPDNQIPYVDEYKRIMIPDVATALSALRTGKVDLFPGSGGGVATWQQGASLGDSSPDIVQNWIPNPGITLDFRCDKEPFTDINVRKAMQLALDLPQIAATHWGGIAADGTPAGLISPYYAGWTTPYAEWPEELQEEYSYNPEKAKQLMVDAGYPDGFQTNIVCCSTDDLDLLQISQAYFSELGIEMEIETFADFPSLFNFISAGKHDQMCMSNNTGNLMRPDMSLGARTTGHFMNMTYNNDEYFDSLVAKFTDAKTLEEAMDFCSQADMHAITQHWSVNIFPYNNPVFIQPWIEGYSGERSFVYDRLWIDQAGKAASGN